MNFAARILIPFLAFFVQFVFAQTFIESYPDGSKFHEGKYKNGLRVESHEYFYQNGDRWVELEFDKEGMPITCLTWDEEGNIMEEIAYEDLTLAELKSIDYRESIDGPSYFIEDDSPKMPWPKDASKVTVHYAGYLDCGVEFDNSWKRGKPFKFKLGKEEVIPGFEKAVQLLSPGQTGWFKMDYDLGYGPWPVGNIPPFSTLIYKIELIEIK